MGRFLVSQATGMIVGRGTKLSSLCLAPHHLHTKWATQELNLVLFYSNVWCYWLPFQRLLVEISGISLLLLMLITDGRLYPFPLPALFFRLLIPGSSWTHVEPREGLSFKLWSMKLRFYGLLTYSYFSGLVVLTHLSWLIFFLDFPCQTRNLAITNFKSNFIPEITDSISRYWNFCK